MHILAKLAAGVVLSAAFYTPALAADLMAPPPPEAAMTSDWTGMYVGVGGNYISWPAPDQIGAIEAIAGANFQTGMFLAGIKGWIGYGYDVNLGGSSWYYGGEGRGGLVISDSVLVYGSAGTEAFILGAQYATAGVGVEFKATDSLSIDLEAKHYWTIVPGLNDGNSITASLLWHIK
jgi:opacity protein-like surface antigen